MMQRALLGAAGLWAALTLVGVITLPHTLNPDVAMYLEIGDKLLDGARPYLDYEEINFPMIHALSALPAGVARAVGWPNTLVFQALLLGLTAAALMLVRRTVRGVPLAAGVVAVAAVGWYLHLTLQWGQREHIFVLLYLPFLALRVHRREGGQVGTGAALAVGLMAGMGVAIKPYFALTAVLVEGLGLVLSRRWHLRTPEVLGVGLVAAAHVAYFALNPEVLAAFIVLIGRLQAGYAAYPPASLTDQAALYAVTGLVLVGWAWRRRIDGAPRALPDALAMMTLASALGVALQGKGWAYHAIPMLVAAAWLGVLVLAGWVGRQAAPSWPMRARLRFLAGVGVVGLCVIHAAMSVHLVRDPLGLFAFAPYIERYTLPDERVLILNTAPNPAHPLLNALQRRSASRYAMAHPFPIAYVGYDGLPAAHPQHIAPPYMQDYLDALEADLTLHQPPLVFIHAERCPACPQGFGNLHDYLSVRGHLAAWLTPSYALLTQDRGYHIYVRRDLATR